MIFHRRPFAIKFLNAFFQQVHLLVSSQTIGNIITVTHRKVGYSRKDNRQYLVSYYMVTVYKPVFSGVHLSVFNSSVLKASSHVRMFPGPIRLPYSIFTLSAIPWALKEQPRK